MSGATPRNRGRLFWGVVLVVALVATGLHLFRLGEIPAPLFIDEAAIGYNAYSVGLTGADEYGVRFPLFFRCFDNYHDPVMVYTLVPLVYWSGLTPFVVRLPSAVFALLAAVAFGLLVQEYLRNRWWALAGGALFAVLPWVFPLSRSAMGGYTPMLLGICLGLTFLLRAFRQRSLAWAIAAGAAWSLAFYAHNIGRPMSAVVLLGFVVCFNRLLWRRWAVGLAFSASLIGLCLPLVLAVLRQPQSLTARFSTLAVWHDAPAVTELAKRLAVRYLDYLNPWFVFWRGDENLRHTTGVAADLRRPRLFAVPGDPAVRPGRRRLGGVPRLAARPLPPARAGADDLSVRRHPDARSDARHALPQRGALLGPAGDHRDARLVALPRLVDSGHREGIGHLSAG